MMRLLIHLGHQLPISSIASCQDIPEKFRASSTPTAASTPNKYSPSTTSAKPTGMPTGTRPDHLTYTPRPLCWLDGALFNLPGTKTIPSVPAPVLVSRSRPKLAMNLGKRCGGYI
ncbi:hypothetical protein BDW68DRAFT_167666 [Aspergillus falconensis]